MQVMITALPDTFIQQGSDKELREIYGLTAEAAAERILAFKKGEKS